jgi:PRTRC genetic system protein A
VKIYNAGEQIPENEEFCHIVAKDGIYLKKSNHFYECIVKVNGIPSLPAQEESLLLKAGVPKIPYSLVEEAISFFRAVQKEHSSEAAVLLIYNDKESKWSIKPVRQKVSGASVKYEVDGVPGVCGTIHSHCGMSAFFSGTDNEDDSQIDGFHIVVGNVDSRTPEIAISVTANGRRFSGTAEILIDGLPSPEAKHPWLSFVEKESNFLQDRIVPMQPVTLFDGKEEQKKEGEKKKKIPRYQFLKTLKEIRDWPEESKEELVDSLFNDYEWWE